MVDGTVGVLTLRDGSEFVVREEAYRALVEAWRGVKSGKDRDSVYRAVLAGDGEVVFQVSDIAHLSLLTERARDVMTKLWDEPEQGEEWRA